MKLGVAIAGAEALPSAFVVFRGIDQSVRKASALGYDGVELALMRPEEIDKSHLKALLKDTGMEISAISSGQVWAARHLCFTEEDKEKREELKRTFCGFIDLASDFGQMVNIGRTRGGINGRDKNLCEELFVDMARYLSEYAQKRGVTLILEPVNRYEIDFVNNLDECVEQIKLVDRPNFSMMIETTVSISEIEEVSAASATSRKNTMPTIRPPVMDSNTFGSVMNIRLGPLFSADASPPENNDHAGQHRNAGIEQLNLPDGTLQRILLAHIRAVCHENAHCNGHGIEKLSHCGGDCFQECPEGEAVQIRQKVIFQSLRCAVQCQRIDRDPDRQQDEQRHHDLADALNALVDAEDDDHGSQEQEN